MIILSEDGYIRLSLETFQSTPLVHLLSGLDEDSPIHSREGASLARISGYTEWVSTTTPIITLGWDWQMDVLQENACYTMLGAPRSNVMLVDAMQIDLGPTETEERLKAAINAFNWQPEVQKHIAARYV